MIAYFFNLFQLMMFHIRIKHSKFHFALQDFDEQSSDAMVTPRCKPVASSTSDATVALGVHHHVILRRLHQHLALARQLFRTLGI